ncbi:MAG: Trk system potassium transporter TrkA [Anaerovoracaceae bacterium]|jgi:trk system potassium uptake protein TrkA
MKIAIVGAGKLGTKVANALLGGDHSVTVIDKNEPALQKLSQRLDVMTVASNGKETAMLKEIHISSYDFLVACTDRDEKNIVIASFAKHLGCSKVIARVRDPEHMHQFDFIRECMSIDHLVNPDMEIANEIYKYLVEKYTLTNGMFTVGKIAILECQVEKIPQLIGRQVNAISRILPNMLLISIDRSGKVLIPRGDLEIKAGDGLYIVGERAAITKLNKKVHERGKYTDLRSAMIIGGGKTGLFLAGKLADLGIAVKIVERDKERCYYLSEHLDDVMILNGDGTDTTLLEEENLDEMDAFVTVTGFDEDNLLLALLAKQRGIEDVIAKVSRGIYTEMVSSLGVDMAINPLDISTTHILRLIQGSKRVLSSQVIQGQAEYIEIIADASMKLVNKPIRLLKLPDGIIIAAIHRGEQVIIPNGNTEIQVDDRVFIVCLLTDIPELERLISVRESFLF